MYPMELQNSQGIANLVYMSLSVRCLVNSSIPKLVNPQI